MEYLDSVRSDVRYDVDHVNATEFVGSENFAPFEHKEFGLADRLIAHGQSGFTLLEMIVAVLVVSVMTAVLVPHLLGAGQRAQAEACTENQRMIAGALSEYSLLYGNYPTGNTAAQMQVLVQSKLLENDTQALSTNNYVIADTDPNNVSVGCSSHGFANNVS